MSFGMIFSIILIIVFLAFGFYAITKFLEFQEDVKIEKFLNDFQEDVNSMWKSLQGSQTKTYSLPTKINAVCFKDDEFRNLEFNSKQVINGDYIEHLDIENMTKKEDPFCINNTKGKISLTIVKDYGETLVTIKR